MALVNGSFKMKNFTDGETLNVPAFFGSLQVLDVASPFWPRL